MSMTERQHWLDRVRPPRVQITYDVEANGSVQQIELPFVLGIIADLSGNVEQTRPALADRKFVEIDSDNFNQVMRAIHPALQYSVPSLDGSETPMEVNLRFSTMADFQPTSVIQQVPALNALLTVRQQLRDLLAKIENDPRLFAQAQKILSPPAAAAAAAHPPAPAADQPPAPAAAPAADQPPH